MISRGSNHKKVHDGIEESWIRNDTSINHDITLNLWCYAVQSCLYQPISRNLSKFTILQPVDLLYEIGEELGNWKKELLDQTTKVLLAIDHGYIRVKLKKSVCPSNKLIHCVHISLNLFVNIIYDPNTKHLVLLILFFGPHP